MNCHDGADRRKQAEKHRHRAARGKLDIDATALPQRHHRRLTEHTLRPGGSDAAVEFHDLGEPGSGGSGAFSGKTGILGKLDIQATALPQLHKQRLTAHALEAPNAALYSLVTSQKNRQKRF